MTEKFPGSKALLYARVSTDDKDQRPETQIDMMLKYCEEREIEVVEIYSEKKSGGDMDRHEWNSLMGRVIQGGITFVIARDESRISRNMDDMSVILATLKSFGTIIRYVNSPVEPEKGYGKIFNMINTWQGEEFLHKLRENTSEGMQRRKREGYHMGRFLAFAFEEDLPELMKEYDGIINDDPRRSKNGKTTMVKSEEFIYAYAKDGRSLNYVATKVLGISRSTLITAMMKREDEPDHYITTKGGRRIPCYRYHGLKDRYSVYMTLYNDAIEHRKGVVTERVDNDA